MIPASRLRTLLAVSVCSLGSVVHLSAGVQIADAEHGGAITSTNGMIVFGLGRGPNTAAHFRGAGQEFVLGFLEAAVRDTTGHQRVARNLQHILSKQP